LNTAEERELGDASLKIFSFGSQTNRGHILLNSSAGKINLRRGENMFG
jgi:hypothetical protein